MSRNLSPARLSWTAHEKRDPYIVSGAESFTRAFKDQFGSFNKLSETYAALCGRWAPANGCEIRSLPSYEVYLNAPDETPEDELLTDIYVPIEK
ncbi:MAG: GyrI-like domain-containing protein [Lentisphaerae bacterium]|nr:GyrI-like domain-containing protein [Lentisphaerota bacterium]